MAAIAVPVAFLARDQLRHGVLQGELFTLTGLFGAPLLALLVFKDPPVGVTFGSLPIGPAVVVILLGLILWRALRHRSSPSSFAVSAV
jgi:cytochrome c-type biogenesis protein CcmH/NrfF